MESIRRQTYQDYELIVVCDSCTDDTFRIASGYADLIDQVDYGRDGLTRNRGIDMAHGEWLLFMDDDDRWAKPDAFERIADALDKDPELDVLCFGFYYNRGPIFYQDEGKLAIAVWNKAWRRSFVGDTRFSDVPYISDVGFHQAMLEKRPRTGYLMSALYFYNYLRPGSISWRKQQGEI